MKITDMLIIALIAAASTQCVDAQPPRLVRNATMPRPSPDGSRIVFASARSGKSGIYTMAFDGSEVRQVTAPGTDQGPDWSPDGKLIAFFSVTPMTSGMNHASGMMLEVNVINADGTERRRVGETHAAPWPRFSRTGQLIYPGADSAGKSEIVIVNPDGSGQQKLDTRVADAADPIWSPDGKSIAFTQIAGEMTGNTDPETLTTNVYVIPAQGGASKLLGSYHGYIQLPTWSPDGETIAFQTFTARRGIADIVTLDITTGRFTTLTTRDRPYLDETPAFTPDGRILFQSTRDGSYEVYVMNADGSGQKRISR